LFLVGRRTLPETITDTVAEPAGAVVADASPAVAREMIAASATST
jgi:hypothetical protein